MSESTIVAAICRELAERGAWWVKTHGAGVGRSGIPDLIAVYRGAALCLEAKQPGRYPTRLQRHELAGARRAGAHAHVVRSRAEVAEILDTIDAQLDGAPSAEGAA